ncbi:ATP-binding protein [Zhouia sp. PK063]|uniref:sensor histidine kinase n=1 Tax=Zhouia sp. PK063 TaxID=3373602 RepID=UPI0037AB3FB2
MNQEIKINRFFNAFFLRKLTSSIIIVFAVFNILAWLFEKIAYITPFYSINENATMKIITAISFFIVGISHFITSKKVLKYLIAFGLLICSIQLVNIHLVTFFKSSSEATIFLFVTTFFEIYYKRVQENMRIAILLNSIIYTITLFSIYFFVIQPELLANIPGFQSVSWNTALLFYFNVLSCFEYIFSKGINSVYNTYQQNFEVNPFKFFPLFFIVPILLVIITSVLTSFGIITSEVGIFIILFIFNIIIILAAGVFTSKFTKLFKMIIKAQEDLKENNIQLSEINKNLNEKNQYLEDFTSIASHNLKEPIIALNNLGQFKNNPEFEGMLTEEEIDKMFQTNVKNLTESIEALNKFLTFIRKSDRKQFEIISLEDSLVNNINALRNFVPNASEKVTYTIIDSISFPKIYIDSVFYNLLTNAYKYSHPDRALKISIEGKLTNDKQHYVLTVKDNGLGINLDKYGNDVFKPRKRFHKTPFPSSGYGLYFTKLHVQKLNGIISVESTEEIGSTFTIIFKTGTYESSDNR